MANTDEILEPSSGFQRGFLKLIVILVFIALIFPGAQALLGYYVAIIRGVDLDGFSSFFFDRILPNSGGLPGELATLAAAALPVVMARACYKSISRDVLNWAGIGCCILAVFGALVNLAGYYAVFHPEALSALATADKIQLLKDLCGKATYLCVFYALAFLSLRPR